MEALPELRPGAQRKLTGKEEAPSGGDCLLQTTSRRWTPELLAGEVVKLTEHGELSHAAVRRRLAENDLEPWCKDMWCIPHGGRARPLCRGR